MLRMLIQDLPPEFPAPIGIVLHVAGHSPGFVPDGLSRVAACSQPKHATGSGPAACRRAVRISYERSRNQYGPLASLASLASLE
jgi:hypothetical protein